jgi:putative transposase
VLLTGIPCRALPRCYGAATPAHDRFQAWAEAGVSETLWRSALLEYDATVGLRWTWQTMDGARTEAPLGGEATGPNPTDRAKLGAKRSLLTDGADIPLGVALRPANRNDHRPLPATLASPPISPPPSASQHMGLDKGYDYPGVREALAAEEFVTHIRSRGEEVREKERNRKRRPHRWVVEWTHSWLNRFRRLLVRWKRKVANHPALAQFACAWITYRAAGLFAAL